MMQKTIAIARRKNVALVAHDNKKEELVEWAKFNCRLLAEHSLCSTRTTGQLLKNRLGLRVALLESGPLGGDQQIGSRISEGQIDFVIFFSDPLQSQPHDPDVKALLRITIVWNVPVACNRASADFIISSPLMSTGYERLIPDYSKNRSPLAIGTRSKPATERALGALLVSGKPAENRLNATTIEPSVGPIDGHSAWLNEWRWQNVVGIAMALVFSGLAPALLMTAVFWSDPRVVPMVFSFTLAFALGHAVLFGLPIFLILQSYGWGGATASVVGGFAIGAVPAAILSFPVSDGLNAAALRVGYVQSLMYFGLLGAFGGIVFWAVLRLCSAARFDSASCAACALPAGAPAREALHPTPTERSCMLNGTA